MLLLAFLPPLFWAGNFIVAGLMRAEIPPVQMSAWRWVLASVIMLPFGLRPLLANLRIAREEALYLAWLSLIGVTAFNSLIYVALHHTDVLNAAILNSLMPVATFLLAFLLIGVRPTPRQATGAGLALLGALVIVLRGDPGRLVTFQLNAGDLLVVVAMSSWALYTVLLKKRPSRLPLPAFLLLTFALGTLFHLPFVLWERSTSGGFTPDVASVSALLYLAIFPSILAYVLWNRAVRALGPAQTAVFMYAMPVFTAVLAILLLGERLYLFHLFGAALIVAGISLVTNPGARVAARPARSG